MATVSGGEKSKGDYGVNDEADEYDAEFDVEENIEGEYGGELDRDSNILGE